MTCGFCGWHCTWNESLTHIVCTNPKCGAIDSQIPEDEINCGDDGDDDDDR